MVKISQEGNWKESVISVSITYLPNDLGQVIKLNSKCFSSTEIQGIIILSTLLGVVRLKSDHAFFFFFNIYLFLAAPGLSCGMQTLSCIMHAGSSSLTRD